MDSSSSAQDVARCDLCKIAIAQNYCDFCHVNLCKPCIGEHISDEYDKHKIVPFLQRKSTLIYPKCVIHNNKACEHRCTECDIFVCSFCTASKQHRGHEFLELEELFKTKKQNIQNDAEELESQIMPAYKEIAIDLEKQIASLDDEYKNLTTEISKQREEIHREIDIVINQMEKEIDEIKGKHQSILHKHLDEIKQLQSSTQQSLLSLHEMEESNEVSSTIQYSSKNEKFGMIPPKLKIIMPKFIPKQIQRERLRNVFGEITSLSTTMEDREYTSKNPNTSVRELLDEPKVLNTIKAGQKRLRNVVCLNEEQIWTSGGTAEIKCFNIQGVLQNTIKTKLGNSPWDIAVNRDGALLYHDFEARSVYIVMNDQTEEIITLQGWTPNNLCVTSSGDLLVTMYTYDGTQSKVVRYSGSTVKQTIQFDDEGQPLYSRFDYTKYITENRNLDICVADFGAYAVVVVNQAGKLRFRYTGHTLLSKKEPFRPRGITTDTQSRILTADSNNHCIHILEENGQFLRYIDNCDLKDPFGLYLDNNGNLFVCEYGRSNVKQIKYVE
uniref:Uncharacterized protein LOC111107830 n=1 Tax=Crassostrea virginica TaxID=6565 RepID=A0A8B8B680_CRAVI|nr:uncharacterized protein LOC111107830 [Crassostrea virginica]